MQLILDGFRGLRAFFRLTMDPLLFVVVLMIALYASSYVMLSYF